MKKIIASLLFILTILLVSCNNDYSSFEEFEEKVLEFSKSDSKISKVEFDELKDEILLFEGERDFRKFYSKGNFNEANLLKYLLNKGYTVDKLEVVINTNQNNFVNVYIENSGSMNGYVTGSTEFKEALLDLIIMLRAKYNDNFSLNFINTKIYPTKIHNDLDYFTKNFNAASIKVGNTYTSNINDIYKQILNKTVKNTVSILFSDCIYAIKDGKSEDLLTYQKSLTKDAFLTKFKSKENLATTIIKMNSDFNGIYYDKNNGKHTLNAVKRPYYITVIASDETMADFESKIELSKNKIVGFDQKHTFSLSNYSNKIYYSLIKRKKNDFGKYMPDKDFPEKGALKAIKEISVEDRNSSKFIFAVAVDLSLVPADGSYIMNKKNFIITNGNYIINDIRPYQKEELNPSSAVMISHAKAKPTHYIVFESTNSNFSDLTFSLKKQLPQWIVDTNTNDDTTIKGNENKTFGIKYLMQGIQEAYDDEAENNNFFELTIKIKK